MTFQDAIKSALQQLGDDESTVAHKIRQLWLTKPMQKFHETIPSGQENQTVDDLVALVLYYREHPEELTENKNKQRLRRRNQ